MANVAVSAGKQENTAPKYPLGVRLKAWWLGEDTVDVFARLPVKDAAGRAKNKAERRRVRPKVDLSLALDTSKHWTPSRITAAQMVWGKGFAAAGNEAYITNLVNVAGLNPDMSILDLSAGLGGAARALSERFGGLWITALESSPDLADVGMEQSKMAGMTKKVPVEKFDPATPVLAKKFDFIFARESFYQFEKKEVLLLAIAKALKPQGQCLLTDLVIREEGLSSEALEAWKNSEPEPVHPWTVAKYRAFFDKLSLPISLSPLDLTEEYCSLVVNGWWNAQNMLIRAKASGDYEDDVLAALSDEVGRWAARTAALQSGDLCVYRFYSDKRRM